MCRQKSWLAAVCFGSPVLSLLRADLVILVFPRPNIGLRFLFARSPVSLRFGGYWIRTCGPEQIG